MGWMSLRNEKREELGVVGDSVWDIMGVAIDEIIKEYEEYVGRKPNMDEIQSILDFVCGPIWGNELSKRD